MGGWGVGSWAWGVEGNNSATRNPPAPTPHSQLPTNGNGMRRELLCVWPSIISIRVLRSGIVCSGD
jgi:hypothetical protein